ncbi:Uncharacterised protein [Mycobacterium tuberculosis]|uniref:PPE family protein n=1 Tax=Mycobacterium tuberculosis TaxID=1773 RepID=A0A654U1K5_MYCTX|nr:Uncharacterised protein [Mycobacterium tuberculosis]
MLALAGASFAAAGLSGTGASFAFTGGAATSGVRLSFRNSNAPPPTANRIGQSTSPATPIAPMANAAAAVDLLPLLSPF